MGILPIKLGQAKLEKTTHTFIHYYKLEPLFQQYNTLNEQYENFRTVMSSNSHYVNESKNFEKIIEFTRTNINNKMKNIGFHSTALTKRNKRGLVDGLGTVFKIITGNLDAEDGKRYNKILSDLEQNQHKLENQLKLSYSVNNQIIKNFNSTLQSIQHNENLLQTKLTQLYDIINKFLLDDFTYAKDIFDQFFMLYNPILNILQEIENSVTFCKLRALHPSIIQPDKLLLEIQRISDHYKTQLPFEPKIENILEYEQLLKINCKIEPSQIIYFISIPINFETNFDLYHLVSTPTKHGSEFITIIPESKYILQTNNKIIPLSDMCIQSRVYQCPNTFNAHINPVCEEEIFTKQHTSQCHYIRLEIQDNHLELLTEINQYLAIFPKEEKITINCPERSSIESLTGIYLIKSDTKCDIIFNNEKLIFLDKTDGSPLMPPKLDYKIKTNKISNFSINLSPLKLKDITFNRLTPIEDNSGYVYNHTPNIWTTLLYVVAIIIIMYLITNKLRKYIIKKRIPVTRTVDIEIQLPEGASF